MIDNPVLIPDAMIISFFVPGIAKPGGSKNAFALKNKKTGALLLNKKTGRPIINVVDTSKNQNWKADVKSFALTAMHAAGLRGPVIEALYMSVEFVMLRPKCHFGSGKNAKSLKTGAKPAPLDHTQTPDRTKLLRSLEDAMTGVVWRDDTQIVAGPINKRWTRPGETPGAYVAIYSMEGLRNVRSGPT